MLILDNTGELAQELNDGTFDLEEFFPDLVIVNLDDFYRSPLKARSEIVLVHLPSVAKEEINDNFLAHLNTFWGVLFFVPTPIEKNWQDWLDKVSLLSDKVLGIHYLPLSPFEKTMVRNQLIFFWRLKQEKKKFKQTMIGLSHEVDHLINQAHGELLRSKKIHEATVPKRKDEYKGISLITKYSTGRSSGTELLDAVTTQEYYYIVLNRTNSYLASSCLISVLNKYKNHTGESSFDYRLFLQEAKEEIAAINLHKEKPIQSEITVLRVQLSKLELELMAGGEFDLLCQDKADHGFQVLSLSIGQKHKLSKNNRLLFLSPGFHFNWQKKNPSIGLEQFSADFNKLSSADLLMEFFISLSTQESEEFLEEDATGFVLEVKRNAIHQV